MSVFTSVDFDNHESVVFGYDADSGLKAIIGIHNTHLGPALGGCRMWPYATETEALADVLRLSKGMTYKAAVAGLDFGGGKAVIIGDPRRQKTEALLLAMGRFVHSLGGRYLTAEDVGTTVEDMDVMRRVTPHAHGISDGTGNPSPATAFGVYRGIAAAVSHRFGSAGINGVKVAVQGLGNVGWKLCEYLVSDGARLTISDIDDERVRSAQDTFGAVAVSPEDVHRAKVDVFAPCALGAVIDDRTLPELNAAVVAGAANNQLAEPRHGTALMNRSILYAPDYVINAGGLIDISAEGPDYDPDDVLQSVGRIAGTLTRIFERARADGTPPESVADRMAEERFLGTVREAA